MNYFRPFTLLLFSFVLSLSALANPAAEHTYYNELFTEQGEIREHYRAFLPSYEKLTDQQKLRLRREFKKKFDGDNSLAALPRILTTDEFTELKQGVEQRGLAIMMFLKDHYGAKNYARDQIIPEKVLKRIIERTGEAGFQGVVNPETISFPYGPDIIRDHQGRWKVLEDNVGFIGGMGDLIRARQILFNQFPEYKKLAEQATDPKDFYRDLIETYRSQMKNPNDAIVIFSTPPYADNEDKRLHKILKDLGVELVTKNTQNNLEVTDLGVLLNKYVDGKLVSRKRVGFIIANTEHDLLDLSNEASRALWLRREAQARIEQAKYFQFKPAEVEAVQTALNTKDKNGNLDVVNLEKVLRAQDKAVFSLSEDRRTSVQGLLAAVKKGQVLINYTPGIDFVGDKEFYTYVEDLIRYYLKQEPIIKNVPTQRMYVVGKDDKAELNREAYQDLSNNLNQRVAKIVDGRGGDGVFVFPKIKDESARQQALEFTLREFSRMIGQEFNHPSVLAGDITDTRALSYFGSQKNGNILKVVSGTPWSRGIPMSGDGKVNLSSQGHEFAVVVLPTPAKAPAVHQSQRVLRCEAVYAAAGF